MAHLCDALSTDPRIRRRAVSRWWRAPTRSTIEVRTRRFGSGPGTADGVSQGAHSFHGRKTTREPKGVPVKRFGQTGGPVDDSHLPPLADADRNVRLFGRPGFVPPIDVEVGRRAASAVPTECSLMLRATRPQVIEAAPRGTSSPRWPDVFGCLAGNPLPVNLRVLHGDPWLDLGVRRFSGAQASSPTLVQHASDPIRNAH